MYNVGSRLREIRKQKNITLEELGDKLGKTKGYISKWENGQRPINLTNLQSIAEALEVDIKDFFSNSGTVQNPYTLKDDDWAFVVKELQEKGYTPAEVYFKIAQDQIEKDKNKDN
ncbi:helix-turn-helix domain-containing protein [Cytobacillus horneckiae]|uniref:helix-turn-helix domain-containing protein n=1 Tax=Cytobacillus horneckiae TaxID=549687 RepID=UPI00203D0375|nr:helix-turn-helix transcriptional regulator [Cytobacillus horneckiae]MCM3180195.1 helix-turn-helix domain-containing protein [Cytobacillus horneckiae]